MSLYYSILAFIGIHLFRNHLFFFALFIVCVYIVLILITRSSMLKKLILKTITAEIITREPELKCKASYDYKCRNYTINTLDNVMLGAWVIEPRNIDNDTKYCILFHGNSLNRKGFLQAFGIIDMVARYNIVLMVPDYRGFGDSGGDFDFSKVHYDIDAVFECFKQNYVDKKVYFISFSLGSTVVLEYLKFISNAESIQVNLEKNNEKNIEFNFKAEMLYMNKPDKVILISPFVSLNDTMQQMLGNTSILNALINLFVPRLEKLIDLYPNKAINFMSKENTLIIYSDTDHLIPLKSIDRFSQIAKTKLIKGVDHTEILDKLAWVHLIDFINE